MEVYFNLISTVNVDVEDLLEASSIRKDFFYRIASVTVTLPPLRERPDDILLFANHFLRLLGKKYNKKFALSKKAQNYLLNYPWYGNVRELKHSLTAAGKLAQKVEYLFIF